MAIENLDALARKLGETLKEERLEAEQEAQSNKGERTIFVNTGIDGATGSVASIRGDALTERLAGVLHNMRTV